MKAQYRVLLRSNSAPLRCDLEQLLFQLKQVNNKTQIRIIKKNDRLARPAKAALPVPPVNEEHDAEELAKTVSSWVRDFKNRSNPAAPVSPARKSGKRRKAA